MQIVQDFIPPGRRNRPGHKLDPKYITIHDTANTQTGADAKAHAAYVKSTAAANIPASWHFTVDDSVIIQHLPLNENGWHAGDGSTGTGNRESVGIEICENSNGNRAQAEKNAAWLTAKLLKDFGLPLAAVKQHYDWSGKNCPAQIRARKNGWKDFLAAIEKELKPAAAAPPISSGGALYRVQVGAFAVKANADACLKKAKAAGFKDAFVTTTGAPAAPAPTPKPAPAPAPKPATIKVGSKVKVKKGAKDYNGVQLASFVFARAYDVIQISGDRVVIGQGKVVTAAVRAKDLVLV